MTKEAAANSMERAHRGKARRNSTGRTRPIYAAIDDWRSSEKIKDYFNHKRNTSGIYCQQMYGPRTTWRRNQALAMRKQLKESGDISQGYVAFPARLMTRKRIDTKYILHKDFSNVPVIFDKWHKILKTPKKEEIWFQISLKLLSFFLTTPVSTKLMLFFLLLGWRNTVFVYDLFLTTLCLYFLYTYYFIIYTSLYFYIH